MKQLGDKITFSKEKKLYLNDLHVGSIKSYTET